jgi:hypothetical protein
MQASFSPFSPNQAYANLTIRDTTLWATSTNRLVSVITDKMGKAAIGFSLGAIVGIAILWIIDQKSQKTHDNYDSKQWKRNNYYITDRTAQTEEKDRQKKDLPIQLRLKKIHITAISIILSSLSSAILTLHLNSSIPIFFSTFATGFALGMYGKEYYNKNSMDKIKEFVRWLKKNPEIGTNSTLNIAYYSDYLRYFDLTKLGKEIQEIYSSCQTIDLQSYDLTDTDLINLKKADWFNQFKSVIFNKDTRYPLKSSPKITMVGLKQVMEADVQVLKTLDLSQTNLTDEDLIQMADSNCFVHLNKLSIRHNPKITGKGLGYIIEKGFDDLTMLDISGNSQLLGSELDHWVGKKGFNKLTSLELDNTDITETDLERMLNEVEWFGHLEGLKIERNPKLKRIPNNISLLSDQIPSSDAYTPLVGGGVYYHGSGIFIRQCEDKYFLRDNPELLKLCKADKVAVGKLHESMP